MTTEKEKPVQIFKTFDELCQEKINELQKILREIDATSPRAGEIQKAIDNFKLQIDWWNNN